MEKITIYFYVIGYGHHMLESWVMCDIDNADGDYEIGGPDDTPWTDEWTAIFNPLRILYGGYNAWSRDSVRARVDVKYKIDDKEDIKEFMEPVNLDRTRHTFQRFSSSVFLRTLMRLLDQFPILGRMLNY